MVASTGKMRKSVRFMIDDNPKLKGRRMGFKTNVGTLDRPRGQSLPRDTPYLDWQGLRRTSHDARIHSQIQAWRKASILSEQVNAITANRDPNYLPEVHLKIGEEIYVYSLRHGETPHHQSPAWESNPKCIDEVDHEIFTHTGYVRGSYGRPERLVDVTLKPNDRVVFDNVNDIQDLHDKMHHHLKPEPEQDGTQLSLEESEEPPVPSSVDEDSDLSGESTDNEVVPTSPYEESSSQFPDIPHQHVLSMDRRALFN